MLQKQSRLEPLNEIIEGLYIGDHVAADSKYILSLHRITHILTIGTSLYPKFPHAYTYKWIAILDSPTANLAQHFTSCHNFIKNSLAKGGRILVHCMRGISRSATIVISYLMKEHGMSLPVAAQKVK